VSAPVVVGYTATDAGADALAVGARLAHATGAALHVAIVLPDTGRGAIVPPDAGYDHHLRAQAERWAAEAVQRVSDAVGSGRAHAHVRAGESFAEGLIDAAHDLGAGYIVVGAAGGGGRGRHRLGTVATELLHSADVPVVLAHEGSRLVDASTGITRVTAAVGTRPGADVLLEAAVELATDAAAGLRLISLETVDLPAGLDTAAIRIVGASHAEEVLERAQAALPTGLPADVLVGRGDGIEEAVEAVPWEPTEIAVVGSSRLAPPRRLFLGSTAAKMLHALPVPLIVVPRTRRVEGDPA
jgi:nucleotide-binding universal stress UspA family protein